MPLAGGDQALGAQGDDRLADDGAADARPFDHFFCGWQTGAGHQPAGRDVGGNALADFVNQEWVHLHG